MSKIDDITADIVAIGIDEHDAMVIADCVVTRKSCSWVNTDPVDDAILKDLNDLIKRGSYGITVKVQPIPTRSKFIWEVKVHQ